MLQLTAPVIHKRLFLIKLRCIVRHCLKATILLALAQLLDLMTCPVLLYPKLSGEESTEIILAIKRLRVTYASQTYAPEPVIRPCLTANMAIGHPAMCNGGDDDLLYLFVSSFHKCLPKWQNSISSLDSLALNHKLNYLASCIIFLYFYNMTCIRIYSINLKIPICFY